MAGKAVWDEVGLGGSWQAGMGVTRKGPAWWVRAWQVGLGFVGFVGVGQVLAKHGRRGSARMGKVRVCPVGLGVGWDCWSRHGRQV